MNEKSTPRVSLGKADGDAAETVPADSPRPKPRRFAKADAPRSNPPKFVRYAVIALAVSAAAALISALSLFGQKDWLRRQLETSNAKLKVSDRRTPSQLDHAASSAPMTQLISTIVLILALGFVARIAWRGSYRARWAVIAVWALATFTGTLAGFTYLVTITSDEPGVFKGTAFVAAASLIVAVVLANLRPSIAYFNVNRPTRPAAAGRRGLFASRGAPPAGVAASKPPSSPAGVSKTRDRARTKQRANADSAARGAELARARAKASKSRRSGG